MCNSPTNLVPIFLSHITVGCMEGCLIHSVIGILMLKSISCTVCACFKKKNVIHICTLLICSFLEAILCWNKCTWKCCCFVTHIILCLIALLWTFFGAHACVIPGDFCHIVYTNLPNPLLKHSGCTVVHSAGVFWLTHECFAYVLHCYVLRIR